MTLNRWIAIWTAFAVLAFPALSLANHHEAGEEAAEHPSDMVGKEAADHRSDKAGKEAADHRSDKAGGKAAEHRSDRAAERSNAQWDEDNEGWPEKRRGDDGDDDEKGEKEKKNKSKKQKD